ncbi:hypothetical protein BAUCODRAFT_122015 [Baudoinia panamericana UAMH 10762]|uniref:MHYT domain-containing protein n=1 Tax=Baudoinia panamericana (strain UAMH 10762) TaxID=717646 RepID=M2MLP9_BAUPA|nr:uncharacterized protein BAUCODRAFT_122015 [Baudoinia panamericana UAMH 10762]EMC97581.1 hypothetical protein BAUCODRAFT_122015 [Baudoinia panamericana UAMH 10762]
MYPLHTQIESHFNPAIVAASYFASLCGCLLTIEMLNRRGTALGNLRSWLESLGCAISLGLVGIWCMHFIGNRAIILGDGTPGIQLVYNSGYTTLSVFLPIIGLTLAFSAAEIPTKSKVLHWSLLVCTGIFAGLSVVGMHYIGNFGIANYRLHYVPRFLTASVIIAIGDCMLVLVLFYNLREQWISSWWKRLACACLLAGGVSAMHFTASTQCIYILESYNGLHAIHSRNTQVAVAGALSAAALIVVIGVIAFSRHRSHVLKTRSQKVMLACAMFDPEGRVLVTTEGVLPAREITDKYRHRTFNEDFNTAHPVFQWIFRVSRNWAGVSELIPRMRSHLAAISAGGEDRSKPMSSASSATFSTEPFNDYSIIFRERFCCAAASLAAAMHIPTERIGLLYDKVIDTGTLNAEDRSSKRATVAVLPVGDVESNHSLHLFGRGQLLFLTRQLNSDDADKLLNAGFKFGSIQQVGRSIADTMQIPVPALEHHFNGLKRYINKLDTMEKPGTWLTFFGLVPRPNSKGFDVGVKKDDQDQLPDVQLLPNEPQQWQTDFLQRMDGLRTRGVTTFLEDRNNTDSQRTFDEHQFAKVILQAITELAHQVPGDWFRDARFFARPVLAHYSQNQRSRGQVTWIYAFCVIGDMHTSLEVCNGLARIPLTFFSARQRCYKGSPDHAILTRDIHQEFGPLLARRAGPKPTRRSLYTIRDTMTSRSKLNRAATPRMTHSRSSSFVRSDGESVHELVDKPRKLDDEEMPPLPEKPLDSSENFWGGILVNSETVIKSDSKSDYSSQDGRQLGLGMKVAVGTAKQEDTFVDTLMEVTRTRFMPPRLGA